MYSSTIEGKEVTAHQSGGTVTERFNEIYDGTNKAVLGFVTAKCGNTADIQDIMQDTYMEVYRILLKRGADYAREPQALVLRIARQKLSRYYTLAQRLKAVIPLNAAGADGEEIDISDLEAVSDAFLTEDFVANKLLLEEVRALIHAKPQDVKKVFYLFYDVGLTIPQIAETLAMSESNVKHKLYRTLKELREKVK
jgi:RNA polymerase sigma-70 factor (ECF subfamily)